MDVKKLERRNSSMDIIRIVAAFSVLSVHFFLHNGFYSESVTGMGPVGGLFNFISTGNDAAMHGPAMFIMVTMRTLFSICVPMFLLLTGYLMSQKKLSKSYYIGIRKTLIIFVLASILCMMFKAVHENAIAKEAFYRFDLPTMFSAIHKDGAYSFKDYLLSILDFKGANYSWYIEMYIGLFLIAPFLNLAYNKLNSQRQKQVLVGTFVFITIIPSLFNIFNFQTASWWMDPTSSDEYQKLIPSFWIGIYPITFYFTGCYLREYGIKLRTRTTVAVLCISLLLFSAFNWFRSYGGTFKSGVYVYWYGFEPYILSTLIFVLLSRIKTDKWHPAAKIALWKVSDLALGIYLMSYVFDELIYKVLKENVPVMVDRLPYYFITVPLSFLFAAVTSYLMNLLTKLIIFLYEKIKAYVIKQKNSPQKLPWQDILFYVLMAGGLIFALWKTKYGFGGSDEAFYLTIPHRLLMGDALFTDEWNLTLMSSILQLPFVWLYTMFNGSTEGIVLAARIFYVFVHAAACVLIYHKLKKHGIIAMIGTFLYFIYTPYNIMALSYDSMGVGLMVLCGVLLATANYDKKLQLIFSGLCLAGAVLCCPYLAVLYVLYGLGVLAHFLLRKREGKMVLKNKMFAPKTFLFFSIGIFALAAVFLVFTLSRASIGDIMKNLPEMLKDPEHPSMSLKDKFITYFKSTYDMNPLFRYAVYTYGVMMIAMIIDRKRRLHRSVYLTITAGVVIFTQVLLLSGLGSTTYNSIMYPMLFIGITSYILCKDKPRTFFAALFIPGIVYSFCIHFSSNQYFYVISMAMTVANVASYVFLARLIKEMRETPDNITYVTSVKCFSFGLVTLMLVLQGSFQISSKATHVFWESEPSKLTSMIDEGAASGIYTNQNRLTEYQKYYSDMQEYSSKARGNILFLSKNTWFYLDVEDFDYGTYSAWLAGEGDSTLDRLKTFYSMNPEKTPQYVYVPKDSKWDFLKLKQLATQNGYVVSENPISYKLEKPMITK